mmetsp:Transcript_14716/g.23181  ORF Transcript_14716/g.23181 Transcript_14716/m.23181 type:complete len:244 (-) Transcript_14716:335-1066(-)
MFLGNLDNESFSLFTKIISTSEPLFSTPPDFASSGTSPADKLTRATSFISSPISSGSKSVARMSSSTDVSEYVDSSRATTGTGGGSGGAAPPKLGTAPYEEATGTGLERGGSLIPMVDCTIFGRGGDTRRFLAAPWPAASEVVADCAWYEDWVNWFMVLTSDASLSISLVIFESWDFNDCTCFLNESTSCFSAVSVWFVFRISTSRWGFPRWNFSWRNFQYLDSISSSASRMRIGSDLILRKP